MKHYLLIESQSEYEAPSASEFLDAAVALKHQGADVEIMLIQNGVIAARVGANASALPNAIAAGVPVWADEFSLKERALPAISLRHGVSAASLGKIIQRMADGWNVVWH